jgi:hypothetical protein
LSFAQLRDVRAARQSAEVPVKHQQQPPAGVIGQAADRTGRVRKRKIDGRFSNERHGGPTV